MSGHVIREGSHITTSPTGIDIVTIEEELEEGRWGVVTVLLVHSILESLILVLMLLRLVHLVEPIH